MFKYGNSLTIGYFNQILAGEWSLLPWIGAVKASQLHNVNLISFHGNSILDNVGFNAQGNTVYDLARGGNLDGLITWKGNITWCINDDEVSEFCDRYNIPIVTIEGSHKGYPCVTYGSYEGMCMMVKHLIEIHGYKKIGYMGLVENHFGYQERHRGYLDTMKAYNINIDSELIKPWASWIPTIDGHPKNEILDAWLKSVVKSKMEAIIGACDPIAQWIMERLEKLGIHVPDDIAVVGFDGFTESKITNPPLTTIDPSWSELGKVAFERMIEILNGKSVPERTIVPANIVISRTCGCMERNISFSDTKIKKHFFTFLTNQNVKNKIITILKENTEEDNKQTIENLFKAFINESKGKDKNRFLKELDTILRKSFNERKDIIK